MRRMDHKGISLIELLVVTAISGILFGAVALFLVRSFAIPREQAEQGAIVAEAQRHLERLSDTLRNARNESGEAWIASAEPCSLGVRTNIDTDAAAELVTYTLDDATATLQRQVDGGAPVIVARSVRNVCDTTPLFAYYSLGGGRALRLQASPPALTEIDRIEIQLVIDVDLNQAPGAVTLETAVTPREGEAL